MNWKEKCRQQHCRVCQNPDATEWREQIAQHFEVPEGFVTGEWECPDATDEPPRPAMPRKTKKKSSATSSPANVPPSRQQPTEKIPDCPHRGRIVKKRSCCTYIFCDEKNIVLNQKKCRYCDIPKDSDAAHK